VSVDLREWLGRVRERTARVGIIGLGYVGLPLTLLFSEERFRVTGFDIDRAKVERLNAGGSYIHRIEGEHIQEAQRAGFEATTDFARIAEVDAVLICVPTPLDDEHAPDICARGSWWCSRARRIRGRRRRSWWRRSTGMALLGVCRCCVGAMAIWMEILMA
jgi:aspartate-semialdehyde dehydrogenase